MASPTRPKSRTALLAQASKHNAATVEALRQIDLRTTRGELRDEIREARLEADRLGVHLALALQADAPVAPLRAAV